ncbi:hypothetical protein BDV11DRAFT_38761 [Aspergillus similis]
MKWERLERVEEEFGDGMGSKIKKVQGRGAPASPDAGGRVRKGAGVDPLHWTYGGGVVLLLFCTFFFPGLQCLTRQKDWSRASDS